MSKIIIYDNFTLTSRCNTQPLSLLPCPLSRIELYLLSPRVEFLPQKAIMGLHSPIKKRIRLSDIY